MTDQTPESEADFPEVAISPVKALLGLILLAALYASLFVWLGVQTHRGLWPLLASLYVASTLLVLSYIDLRTGLLPDALTLPFTASGLIYAAVITRDWPMSLAGVILGYGLIAGLAWLWRHYRGQEGIGLGDAKLLAGIGAWVGITGLPIVLMIASGAGLFVAWIVSQKARSEEQLTAIAFGPFLAFGAWGVWCGGVMIAI
ncbi:MAG: A24 family peptidase [Pseudomonadota bacterium]